MCCKTIFYIWADAGVLISTKKANLSMSLLTKKGCVKSIENRHSEFISESHHADYPLL